MIPRFRVANDSGRRALDGSVAGGDGSRGERTLHSEHCQHKSAASAFVHSLSTLWYWVLALFIDDFPN